MKVKKIGNFLKFILSEGVIGITLAPFGIYIDPKYINNECVINHERIHWKQQVEMLVVFFYLWYGIEWLWKMIMYGKQGYYAISFEREAYTNDLNLKYLEERKMYSWVKELFK